MHQFFEDYLERLSTLHGHIERAIEGLSMEALNWSPGPEINSVCVLVVHLCGAERFWIGDVTGQLPSGRDRDAEFEAQGMDEAALKRRLDETLAHSRAVVERLSLDDLAAPRSSPRGERAFTVGWALAHALEHTGIHLGHIQIMRQWWEQRPAVDGRDRRSPSI